MSEDYCDNKSKKYDCLCQNCFVY